ncbi:TrmH family RNA methyltransferase [Lysinibacter cavernae]|uniref:tRNA G18 (Ribose-2'-O)-methylase SpoU n=1 Tax=Lysinibacter cavernae TaxID=1640652 RepID=A0A7X5QZD1_9MICO|nr:RNA methyltransferase [Lysinibacter cavernae]NIH52800.1 tRNA G18 (ribose-2'-O)-methylase SpoU [Lysinibacter cavernae]
MRLIPVDRLDLPQLASFAKLTDVNLRRVQEPKAGMYVAEGSKVIARAIEAGHIPQAVLLEEKWVEQVEPILAGHPDVEVFVGTAAVLEELTGYAVHRGALAAMIRPQLPPVIDLLKDASRVIILEDIVDHTNVGAIFRSVAALGADAVLITQRCADPLYRRSVKVSMGTVFQVPWTRLGEWSETTEQLHAEGFHIAALALSDYSVDLDQFAAQQHEKIAFVVGTEGDGLSRRALGSADTIVTIPMRAGVDSLNVAAASAVALWELRKR